MLRSIACASAAAFLLWSPAAFAAPCTTANTCTITGLNGTTTLSPSNPLAIEDENLEVGAYAASGSFSVAMEFPTISGNADVAFDAVPPGQSVVPAGIMNLVIEFFQDGMSLGAFSITDGQGLIMAGADSFMFNLISTSDIMFNITGVAFRNSGAALADYDINLTAVPLPGALPLILAGIAGLGFASRAGGSRKKSNAK